MENKADSLTTLLPFGLQVLNLFSVSSDGCPCSISQIKEFSFAPTICSALPVCTRLLRQPQQSSKILHGGKTLNARQNIGPRPAVPTHPPSRSTRPVTEKPGLSPARMRAAQTSSCSKCQGLTLLASRPDMEL